MARRSTRRADIRGGTPSWDPIHHPRDAKGRFTKSVTRVAKPADLNKAKAALKTFDAHQFGLDAEASAYLGGLHLPSSPAVDAYRAGSWREVNAALRSGKSHADAAEIDAAMAPLPDDLILTRAVPAEMFGNRPIENLNRTVVRDAAYASTSLNGARAGGNPGEVTMHIAAPAGTMAAIDPASREVILARDTEMVVSRVVPDGRGGYDMYLVVLPAKGQLRGQSTIEEIKPHDPTEGVDLAGLSDDDLFDLFSQVSSADHLNEAALQRVTDELDRRDQESAASGPVEPNWLDAPANEAYGWPEPDSLTPEQQRLDDLLAKGWDYLDAYAEAYNVDPAQLARQAVADAVDRHAGETLYQAVRRGYDEWVHLQYLQAETATRGHLLSAAGEAAGIDPVSLFSGAVSRARKYASEDLLRWWSDNTRLTFTEFKAQTLGREADVRAAEKTRLQSNDKDFL